MTENNTCDISSGEEQLPAWLAEALKTTRDELLARREEPGTVSEAFVDRCRRSAQVALSLAKLRKERERIGFVSLSLADYLQGIAKTAQVSLDPILEWLGIDNLVRPTPVSARGFARLAQELGMGLREVLLHVRVALAQEVGAPPIAILSARYRAGGVRLSEADECEASLRQIEHGYSPAERRVLSEVEAEVRRFYDAADAG